MLVPVFTDLKKSEEHFCFYRKRLKKKKSYSHSASVLQGTVQEVARIPSSGGPTKFPTPDNAQHLSVKLPKLSAMSVSIWALPGFIFAHPLTRCV